MPFRPSLRPRLVFFFSPFLLLPFFFSAHGAQQTFLIPAGTILPVSLKHTFSSNDSRKGNVIEARVMQDVPLPNDDKIPAGATLYGTVVSATPSSGDAGGKISFRFDKLEFHHTTVPLVTGFRALAPMVDVQGAQFADSPADAGSPGGWSTTVQIGGDIRYGVGGAVKNRHKETVGKGVPNGVLVHISAPLGSPCQGATEGDERLQALWVFSADSCGIYDLPGVQIVTTGRSEPLGEITLSKNKGDLKMENSAGILLRVLR